MSMKVVIALLMLLAGDNLRADEYIYPVDMFDQKNARSILLMHQTHQKEMRVFVWNRETHQVAETLAIQCQPTGVRMLPDRSAFSFIEEDILKVQEFAKRSPQLILFDEPIYGLSLVWWIDAQHYYFSAQDEGRYGIYQGNRKGVVDPLIVDDQYDYVYPQKIDSTLFCVRRCAGLHHIISLPYPVLDQLDDDADETKIMSRLQRIAELDCGAHTLHVPVQILCDAGTDPVTFLYMVSATRGFYMTHPAKIDAGKPSITCLYHELLLDQKEQCWIHRILFTFSIPLYMVQLAGTKGLVETIYPLLPQYVPDQDVIMYVTTTPEMNSNGKQWQVMRFDCRTLVGTPVYQSDTPILRPSVWNNHLYMGRTVTDDQPLFDKVAVERKLPGNYLSLIEMGI